MSIEAMTPQQIALQEKMKLAVLEISGQAQDSMPTIDAVQFVCNLLVLHIVNLALFGYGNDLDKAKQYINRLIDHHGEAQIKHNTAAALAAKSKETMQ